MSPSPRIRMLKAREEQLRAAAIAARRRGQFKRAADFTKQADQVRRQIAALHAAEMGRKKPAPPWRPSATSSAASGPEGKRSGGKRDTRDGLTPLQQRRLEKLRGKILQWKLRYERHTKEGHRVRAKKALKMWRRYIAERQYLLDRAGRFTLAPGSRWLMRRVRGRRITEVPRSQMNRSAPRRAAPPAPLTPLLSLQRRRQGLNPLLDEPFLAPHHRPPAWGPRNDIPIPTTSIGPMPPRPLLMDPRLEQPGPAPAMVDDYVQPLGPSAESAETYEDDTPDTTDTSNSWMKWGLGVLLLVGVAYASQQKGGAGAAGGRPGSASAPKRIPASSGVPDYLSGLEPPRPNPRRRRKATR